MPWDRRLGEPHSQSGYREEDINSFRCPLQVLFVEETNSSLLMNNNILEILHIFKSIFFSVFNWKCVRIVCEYLSSEHRLARRLLQKALLFSGVHIYDRKGNGIFFT